METDKSQCISSLSYKPITDFKRSNFEAEKKSPLVGWIVCSHNFPQTIA
jgi:hypothetical protein